jgi:protein phosphatase
MDVYGMTHVGRKRLANEDQFLIAELKKSLSVYQTSLGLDHQTRLFGGSQGRLLLVADGMGGHEAGERASTIAVDSIATYTLNTMRWFFRLDEVSDEDFYEELKAALEHCQSMIDVEVEAIPQRRGMGTTLTMAYVIWPRMYVVHAGDSRCYLFRNSLLKQITRDHTMAQLFKEQRDAGVESEVPDDSESSRWSNTLWNVLGGDSNDLAPDVYRANLQLGDTLLLCTDGLTKHLSDDRIKEHLNKVGPAEKICQGLVEAANTDGGTDNITVVVARLCEQTNEPCEEEAEAATRIDAPVQKTADTDPYIMPVKLGPPR